MIIGKINKNEKRIKFHLDIACTNCGKSVPGGMQASENYYATDLFKLELDTFMKNYLCGICRDKKKITDSR
jgi:hypothetical protein